MRACRWEKKPEKPYPREDVSSARLRSALVWRWLSESNQGQTNIAVFTHSKLIMKDVRHPLTKELYGIRLLGPTIPKIQNGEIVHVRFEAAPVKGRGGSGASGVGSHHGRALSLAVASAGLVVVLLALALARK